MIESYDKITIRQGRSLGISEMGKDIGLEWREVNSGNEATVSISGNIVTTPQGIPDLRVLINTGFNDCGKLVIQVARKNIFMKIDLVRKQNGEPFTG